MISIIIPHYNRAALLQTAVESVLRQSCGKWELIIVDDRSYREEFATAKALEHLDKRIKVLTRQSPHKGPSSCRNEGVAASHGSFLVFLDSDDLLAPFCVQQRLEAMTNHPEVDMGIFLMKEFAATPEDSSRIFNKISANVINSFLEGNNPWAVTCPVWRKEYFLHIGGFDESFLYMEDPDLHVRALLEEGMTYRTFYDYPADCYYRMNFHDATKMNFYQNSIRYRTRYYKKMEEIIDARANGNVSYKKSFERGVINFFSNFLLSRIKEFPQLHREFMEWAHTSKLLSPITGLKLKILSAVFSNDNMITRKIRLKGFASKILIPGVLS